MLKAHSQELRLTHDTAAEVCHTEKIEKSYHRGNATVCQSCTCQIQFVWISLQWPWRSRTSGAASMRWTGTWSPEASFQPHFAPLLPSPRSTWTLPIWWEELFLYKKWAITGLFFIYFRHFKHTLQFLQQINLKNVHPVYGAGNRTHNLQNMSLLP